MCLLSAALCAYKHDSNLPLLCPATLVPDHQGTNNYCLGTPYLYFHGRLVWAVTFDSLGTSATNPLGLSMYTYRQSF